jgi:excinuclease ABC subunit A
VDNVMTGESAVARAYLRLRGARERGLKGVDADIPLGAISVIAGVSGSGKSSLAFDTIAMEGFRRFLELSALSEPERAAWFGLRLARVARPRFRALDNLPPVIAVAQGDLACGPRATVGSVAGIAPPLRGLFARLGVAHCPLCQAPRPRGTVADVVRTILTGFDGRPIRILADPGTVPDTEMLKSWPARGILRALAVAGGESTEISLDDEFTIPAGLERLYAVADRLVVRPAHATRLAEAAERALDWGGGTLWIDCNGQRTSATTSRGCPHCRVSLPEPSPALFVTSTAPGRCESCAGQGEDRRSSVPCVECSGTGASALARSVRVEGRTIFDIDAMEAVVARAWVDSMATVEGPHAAALRELRRDLLEKYDSLAALGLGAMSCNRRVSTLSTGEMRRLRVAAAFGARVRGALFVLDEPTTGCHPADRALFLQKIDAVRSQGNTVVVVEHDPAVIGFADHVIEMGPGAGAEGGHIIYSGTPADLRRAGTPTSRILARAGSGAAAWPVAGEPVPGGREIRIRGARGHCLKNIDVTIPVARLTAVAGVSGSGKSSLIFGTLAAAARRALTGESSESHSMLPHDGVDGLQHFARRVVVGPRLPARNARSTPASYLGAAGPLRDLFAATETAKMRGLDASHFSANRSGWRRRDESAAVEGGRCESCAGLGYRELDLELLEPVAVPCEVCGGRRFSAATLAVHWRGKSIADWYELPIAEAAAELEAIPAIRVALQSALDLGLGYLRLGERADRLSGGELQRLQIARELNKTAAAGAALVMLDEPTRGLHGADVQRLVAALKALVSRGHTVVVVEHSLDVMAQAQWLIELGPGAGRAGGQLIYQGEPAGVLRVPHSPTAHALREPVWKPPARRPCAAEARIEIRGACARNLRHIDVDIPHGQFTTLGGPAGSGKTSLALAVLAQEGRRRFVSTFAALAGEEPSGEIPAADRVEGVGATAAFEYLSHDVSLGEATGLQTLLKQLYCSSAVPHCPSCGLAMRKVEPAAVVEIAAQHAGRRSRVLAPLHRREGETAPDALRRCTALGFTRIYCDGREQRLDELDGSLPDSCEVVVDRLLLGDGSRARLLEALGEASIFGGGRGSLQITDGAGGEWLRIGFDRLGGCAACGTRLPREFLPSDFDAPAPGSPAAAATVRGTRWPEAGWRIGDVVALLRAEPDHEDAAARALFESIQIRLRAVREFSGDDDPLDLRGRARVRAAWLAVALAVLSPGTTVVCDEPVAGLDDAAAARMVNILKSAARRGCTVVAATGDPRCTGEADVRLWLGPGSGVDGGRVTESWQEDSAAPRFPRSQRLHVVRADPADSGGRAGVPAPAGACAADLLQIMEPLASLFAKTPEARHAGFDRERFLLHGARSGGCGACKGRGSIETRGGGWLSRRTRCGLCGGARFEPRTLSARLYGRSIGDLLNLTIDEAAAVLADHGDVRELLQCASRLRAGFVPLGAEASQLSDGVRERLRLAVRLRAAARRGAAGESLRVAYASSTLHGSDLAAFLGELNNFCEAGGECYLFDSRDIVGTIAGGASSAPAEHSMTQPDRSNPDSATAVNKKSQRAGKRGEELRR